MTDAELPNRADWLACPLTRRTVAGLDGVVEDAIRTQDAQLRVMCLHVLRRGGKRLRPKLLLVAGTFGEFRADELLAAAAAVELTHVASLYHDDIMDRAPIRRSGATTSARWGNSVAAFAGTYLFAAACDLLASLGSDIAQASGRAMVDLASGQLHEVESAFDLELDEATHLETLERKTGTLFQLPCELGARIARVDRTTLDSLMEYGRWLGLAFQIFDDALDLGGDAHEIGKPALNDLREGVYTLPILKALSHHSPAAEELRELLERATLEDEALATVIGLIGETSAVEQALETARDCAARAREALGHLPDGPGRSSLDALAHYAVARPS